MKLRPTFLILLAGLLLGCQWLAPTAMPAPPKTSLPDTTVPAVTPLPDKPTTEIEAAPSQEATLTQPPAVTLPGSPAAEAYGQIARRRLQALSEGIGARTAGSPGSAQAADWIQNELQKLGYTPLRQTFEISLNKGTKASSANIIAVKAGQSSQELILGAHYDSVSAGQGADDNASGVAVLLEVAERLKDVPTPYTIRFVAFGAEEAGLRGSSYYAGQMTSAQIGNTLAMVNLDSLAAGDHQYVYGTLGAKGVLRDWCLKLAQAQNLPLETQSGKNPEFPAGTTGDFSDHAPFRKLGIQYLYFEATNWDLGQLDGYTQTDLSRGISGEIWHTRFDTLKYLDQVFPGRVDEHLNLFITVLYQLFTQFKG